ncbi:DUF4416 family protein [bacterium]|nr:DUF4416 family protein [candidate division CSSED10-310 bacterium]
MKPLTSPPPCVFFTAILATDQAVFADGCETLIDRFGDPIERLDPRAFKHTNYYRSEMGDGLIKGFLAFTPPFNPGHLSLRKRQMRELEWVFGRHDDDGFHREINIDPGYVNLSQVVLATSKNFSHRLYLQDGVFGEVTLLYHPAGWETLPWTYPDYLIPEVQAFLIRCRNHLKHYLDSHQLDRPSPAPTGDTA